MSEVTDPWREYIFSIMQNFIRKIVIVRNKDKAITALEMIRIDGEKAVIDFKQHGDRLLEELKGLLNTKRDIFEIREED